jgi:signal transduction histidine kinase
MNGAPDARSDDLAHYRRLRQFLFWDLAAVLGGIVLLVVFYIVFAVPELLLVTLTLAAYAVVLLWSLRQAREGMVVRALWAVCSGVWAVNLVVAYLQPVAVIIVAMLAVWPVLIALPYVSGTPLRRLMVGSTVVSAAAMVLAARSPVVVAVPSSVAMSVFIAAVPGIVAVASLVLWQYSSRLNDMLRQARAANDALRESERRLEEKVLERTRELEEARDQALAATRAKSTFLANTSHELRTPLNSIIGFSELMEELLACGQAVELADVKRVQGAARHLLALIDDVLDLSKIEAGRMDIVVERYSVRALVDDVVSLCRPLIKPAVHFDVEFSEDIGHARADVMRVRQTLFNLLSNAAKFTERGIIRLGVAKVEIERPDSADREPWLVFTVADTGVGMSTEERRHLFQPFSQANPTTARKYGGTGLGLALAKRFCDLMGGAIVVDSAPGTGSTFALRLPMWVGGPQSAQEAPATPRNPPSRREGE